MKLFQRGRAAEEDIYKRLSFEREALILPRSWLRPGRRSKTPTTTFRTPATPT